jgi:hypothetical protein
MMLGACQPGPTPTAPAAVGAPTLEPAPLAFAQVQGFVLAPAGVVAAGSANVIAPGGGNVIAPGGGNVIAPGSANVIAPGGANFRTLAANDRPLAGAEVLLADAAGRPIPGYASTATDVQGRYAFPRVPQGFTFSVVVRARDAQARPFDLRTLVTTRPDGNQANVSVGTMLATALLTEGRESSLGELDAEKYQAIVSHLDARYGVDPATDLGDTPSIVGMARRLLGDAPSLQAFVADLKSLLADVKAPLSGLPSPAPSTAPSSAPPSDPPAPTPAPTTPVDGVPPAGAGGGSAGYPAPTLSLGATSHTGVATALGITVRHAAVAPNVRVMESIQVRVTSAAEPNGELVTLTETGEATGVFQGSLAFERLYDDLGTLATIAGTGRIAVNAEGATLQDTVTVTYEGLSQSATYEEPPSTLTGVVTVGGTPRVRARVQLHDATGAMLAETASRPDGAYAFHGVAPGTYTVVIAVDGAATRTVSVTIPSTP